MTQPPTGDASAPPSIIYIIRHGEKPADPAPGTQGQDPPAPAPPAPTSPGPGPSGTLAAAPAGPGADDEIFARAVAHGDEHVIKFADTAAEVYARTGNPVALAAAIHAVELIPRPA